MNTVRSVVTATCLALSLFLLLTVGENPPEQDSWRTVVGR